MLPERKSRLLAKGEYAWQIIENDAVIDGSTKKHNYIFDSGLDMVADYTWANCIKYCRVGDQTTPSGADANYEATIGAKFQHAVTAVGYSVNQSYYTGWVQLFNGVGDFWGCTSSGIGTSGVMMRRTYDFKEQPIGTVSELPAVVYTEIGWSPITTGPLFSRVITRTGVEEHTPIYVREGQILRVIYELTVYIGPSGHAVGDVISGMASAGNAGVQLLGLSCVGSTGQSTYWDAASGANEPAVAVDGFLSTDSSPLSGIGYTADRSTGVHNYYSGCHMFSYTPDTFTRTKRFFVQRNSGAYSGYYSLGIGPRGHFLTPQVPHNAAKYNSYAHVLDTLFQKKVDYVLNAKFIFSWDRL